MTASIVEFESACHVLSSHAIVDRTAPHVDVDRRSIDWEAIHEESRMWSRGERVLFSIAIELYTADAGTISDAVLHLDDENFMRVLEAMKIRRGMLGGFAS